MWDIIPKPSGRRSGRSAALPEARSRCDHFTALETLTPIVTDSSQDKL
jgi:hypothetical protein